LPAHPIALGVRGDEVGDQERVVGAVRLVEPNTRIWSGDHCSVYPPLVEGILFANVKLQPGEAYMGDVMPTIIDLLGVRSPVKLDGRSRLASSAAAAAR